MKMTHDEGPWKDHEIGDVIPGEEIMSYFTMLVETGKSLIRIPCKFTARMPRLESDEALEALVRSRAGEDCHVLQGETASIDGLVAKTSGRLLNSMARWL